MKTLQLQLTDEQFARLDTLAGLTQCTPENLAIASAFTELDSWESWSDFAENIDDALCWYTREPRDASSEKAGKRLEDKAPERLKKLVSNYQLKRCPVPNIIPPSEDFLQTLRDEVLNATCIRKAQLAGLTLYMAACDALGVPWRSVSASPILARPRKSTTRAVRVRLIDRECVKQPTLGTGSMEAPHA